MINLKNIKNIIFDLGGVVLNIDFDKATREFKRMGIDYFEDLEVQCFQNDFLIEFEKGLISPELFRCQIKKLTKLEISNDVIDHAWNSMILDFPPENIGLLRKLKGQFNLYMLSNTNAIHYKFYNEILEETFGIKNISDLFIKGYFSHLEGLRKPDKEFFELVISENKLLTSETMFIDDSQVNIDAAFETGIKVYHLKNGEPLTNLFIMKKNVR